ncbi:hypothetical protein [uncultured Prevotella sp.]|uniref:hypothetical protein n=1 Tax=uncultured Prevotella sp. TaxID=159272 RepID=UPI00263A16AF|nr:hypothetical protein [uncultured Prevotella sp.]MDD7128867.1 hypothetical protein [Prevotella sp.]MDY4499806.1 hypothetical protein [Prevotella sp.]
MEKYHIGQEILKEVKAKFPSVAAFARELCKSSSATYEIFGKTSLDTDLLLKVSKLLDRDFFREFSEKCLNGEVAVEDKDMTEKRVNCLLPEDELHVFTPYNCEMVFEEYFLLPRRKPLVAFCRSRDSITYTDAVSRIGEGIFGEGKVKTLMVDKNALVDFEAQIPHMTALPQKAFVVCYSGSGLQNGFDQIILLSEKLLAASEKHVVVICKNNSRIENLGHPKYISYAEPTFDTWKERIFACVLDNSQNDFVYYRELFRATKNGDCIRGIARCLENHDEEGAQQYLAEAKKLSTFKDTIIKSDGIWERHQISSVILRPEDKNLLGAYNHPVSMWININKETGEISTLEWEGSEGPFIELFKKDFLG